MFKTLLILRHAQSSPKQPGQTDKQRELSKQGVREAIKIGSFIKKQCIPIDSIITSTATRTLSTATIVANGIGYDPALIIQDDEIYKASLRSLLALIHQLDDELNTIILVGHNPHLSFLAEFLSSTEIAEMPPGGVVVLQFTTAWGQVTKASGELLHFILPEVLD